MSNYQNISIEKAKHLINAGANIVDIRDPNSFNSSHIEGSIHLTNENLHEFIEASALDKPIIVVCYHGHSSQQAAECLAEQGFEEVYSMLGGYTAWSGNN